MTLLKKIMLVLIVSIIFIPTKVTPAIVDEPYRDLVRDWVEELKLYESGGREDIVVFDTNSRYSYSCLQFQEATFQQYSLKYHLVGDIMDCNVQTELAVMMIYDNPNNWRHWYTSVEKRGLRKPFFDK